MLRTILAFFGYVKVPTVMVQGSMVTEDVFGKMINTYRALSELDPTLKRCIKDKHCIEDLELGKKAAKAMTNFLRSGKLLDG